MENDSDKTHVAPEARSQSEHRETDSSPASNGGSLAFLKSLAEVSAIFVGFTYVGGWSYVAAYYRTFGLNSLELDLPLPVVCTTAVYQMIRLGWPLLLIFAPALLAWMAFSRRLRSHRPAAIATVLALLLFAASTVGVFLGRRHANADMLIDSSELPDVAFSTRLAKTDQPDCVDHETYGSADCKLLLHSKGTYFFFTPIPGPEAAVFGALDVYTLADSDVTGVHMSTGLERNARNK